MEEQQSLSEIRPEFQKDFEETKVLLLTDEGRANWHFDHLMRSYEDVLQAAGASLYADGSMAFLGAYMSILDIFAVHAVNQCFTEEELAKLGIYYRQQNYLSPIFGMLASQIEIVQERKREKCGGAA